MRNKIFQSIARTYPTHRIDRSRLLSALWRALFYLLQPTQPFAMRTRHYRLMAVPTRDNLTRAIIRRGHWEPLETAVFIDLLKPGAMVVDAGANFGHYALTAANIVGSDGQVIAFEPHPKTFGLLAANAALLSTDNLRAIQAGLSDTSGEITLYADAANPGGHSFFEWNVRRSDGIKETVPVYSLDAFLQKELPGKRLDVLKMDVQGFEMNLLNGARETITNHKPSVLCEITPEALQRAGSSHSELLKFFNDLEYRMTLVDSEAQRLVPASFKALVTALTNTDAEYFDVLFQPAS
jgi:FkbM family methyltransferase